MKTSLPQVLSDYYAAVNDGRTDDAAACFTADALVHDESQDRQGQEAIRAWIAETTQKYHPQVEIIGIQEAGGGHWWPRAVCPVRFRAAQCSSSIRLR